MAAQQRIEVILDLEKAELNASTNGYEGEKCIDEVLKLIGKDISIDKTDEYYARRVTNSLVNNKQGC